MRRLLKISAWTMAGLLLLAVLLGGVVMVAGNTDWGRAQIERLTYRLTGGYVKLAGLGGGFPTELTLTELQLIDSGGVWLTADGISLRWSPLELLRNRVKVDTLHVTRLQMERLPISSGHGGSVSIPDIEVGPFSADAVELGAPLAGTAVTLSLKGTYRMRSLDDANTDVVAHRLNGDGEYTLHLRFDPNRMDASLAVHEPASGPLENLLSLPGLGALSATATLAGPRHAGRIDVDLAAGGLHAEAHGTLDLANQSADLEYAATASAMAPRADLAWGSAALKGHWHGTLSAPTADGRLDAAGLRIAGTTKIAKLTASLTGNAGSLSVRATVDGLEIPGSAPRLFARSPVAIDATLQMNAPGRPLDLRATHALLSLRGHGETQAGKAGEQRVTAELKLPDLAPFSALIAQDVRGTAVINAKLIHGREEDRVNLDSDIRLAGGAAPWLGYLGPRVAVQLAGSLNDKTLAIDNLRVGAHGLTLAASGRAARTAPRLGKPEVRSGADRFIKDLDARWQLDVADLAALSGDVAGTMKVSGRIGGSPSSLLADADMTALLSVRGSARGEVKATVHARDLPSAPNGTLRAQGTLDGAPLTLDAELDRVSRKTLRLLIRDAEWKTAHIQGDLTADSELTQSHGQLVLRVEQLSDFDRLLGMKISGSVTGNLGFLPAQGHTEAKLQVDAKELVVGQIAGNVHLHAQGVADALGLQLAADLPDLYGAPATLTSAGVLNIDARELQLSSASVVYRAETIRLLNPALLSFAKGFAVDDVKIGAKDAVVELKGQVAPVLDLRASLRQVKPDAINVFSPGLLAGGLIEADARLKGSPSSPVGRMRLDATGIRFADDAATGLPAVDIHARAQLADDTATVSATLTAGATSKLTASGTTPLDPNGDLDMKIGGTLDVGLANPLLEARGMHATGDLTVDATVTGNSTAPRIGGGITLAKGSVRDYGHGVNLSDITAEIVGREDGLQIKSFSAKAATGKLAMTGTFGVLRPQWPLDLEITAKDAQPIASNIVTADLDADIHVNGTLRERLDVAGKIDVHHATIGIPNSLPPEVAVLDVRRRGQSAAAAAQQQLVIGVDVTINAPQQVLVQGRGLDADMAGQIKLSGTTDALVASGGLNLVRGSISIAGTRLNFTSDSKVSFDGTGLQQKIDPALDFTVNNTVGDTQAILTITGPADAPVFQFTSNPAGTPPDQILSMLLFNTQNPSSLSALQLAQIGYALASLTGVGGNGFNPLVKLQKSLGLDRLNVGSNTVNTVTGPENSGAAIEAGRYISSRVYVEAKQTNTGNSQVQVDVDLTKHLKLQTRLGNGTAVTQGTTPENDPGSSIGLSYQFEY